MLTIVTTAGLFFGLLSLGVFFLGITPWGVSGEKILIGVVLAGVAFLNLFRKKKPQFKIPQVKFSLWQALMVFVILASCLRILAYSIFYPFVTWDSLAIYGLAAKKIFLSGSTGSLSGQPPFLALSYAIAFFVSGGLNEQLAKAIPAILAIFTIAATYCLGKTVFNPRIGLISAFLLSITPLFKTWSGAGYADVPGAFFFLMAINYFYLALENVKSKNTNIFILAGIFAGLALWTKQSNLILLMSLPIIWMWWGKRSIKQLFLIVLLALFSGGFWYLRNFILSGEFFPAASSWWGQASRSIRNLLPFVGSTDDFGYWLSPLYALSFIFILGFLKNKKILYLLFFVFPCLFLWWYIYSYDTRFLLTILPISTIFCAFFIEEIFLKKKTAFAYPKLFGLLLIAGVSSSTIYAALCLDLLREKSFSIEQKREQHLGDAFRAFKFLKEKEEKENLAVMTTDNRLLFFLDKSETSQEIPKNMSDLKGYDYFLFSPWAEITTSREGWSFKNSQVGVSLNNLNYFSKVFERGDYAVYEIKSR